jgi:hypothetical protein
MQQWATGQHLPWHSLPERLAPAALFGVAAP